MNEAVVQPESQQFTDLLRRASEFFMGGGDVQTTLLRLARQLEAEGIDYALVGALALGRHSLVRFTQDVDVLLTPEGLERFRQRLVGRGYVPACNGARKTFRDTETQVRIKFLTAGEYPGDGKPKPVAFPDPAQAATKIGGVKVIALPRFIELKLASGMAAPHRLRDISDVQDLIAAAKLPASLAEELDPSVRDKYLELWRSVQNVPDEE
jgi:hypothetical protein